MKYLAVKNWRQFQHYSDRRPPWIKNHVALLDDLGYIRMSEGGRAALHALWLLAARLGHPLPNDPQLLRERGLIKPKQLEELKARGWVIETNEQDASVPLAECERAGSDVLPPYTRARERADARSREGEGEREGDTPPPAASGTPASGFRHAMDWTSEQRAAADAYATEHRDPEAFYQALSKLAAPITGNGFGWPVVGQALVEMRANGKEWSTALCAGYCKRIARGPTPDTIPIATARRGGSKQAQNLTAIAEGLAILEAQEAASGNR